MTPRHEGHEPGAEPAGCYDCWAVYDARIPPPPPRTDTMHDSEGMEGTRTMATLRLRNDPPNCERHGDQKPSPSTHEIVGADGEVVANVCRRHATRALEDLQLIEDHNGDVVKDPPPALEQPEQSV